MRERRGILNSHFAERERERESLLTSNVRSLSRFLNGWVIDIGLIGELVASRVVHIRVGGRKILLISQSYHQHLQQDGSVGSHDSHMTHKTVT